MRVEIPRLSVLEPSSEETKRRAAGIFVRKERQPDLVSLKERLKEIRRYARDNHTALLAALEKNLGYYGNITFARARNAREAASSIRDIVADTNLLSLNKSNVVVNELRLELEKAGFTTYLRYYTEFDHFEAYTFQKKLEDYWSLPGMHGRGLMESFEEKKMLEPPGGGPLRNYAAVLGVNAISAADGSVYFLQHMANIAQDLAQAKTVVLVVSLEKILKDRDDALLHTRSMGIFGLESILLDLLPNEGEKFDFDGLPPLGGNPEQTFHLLILDNGRSGLLAGDYRDLFLCIDCRACARQCPIGQHEIMKKGLLYSPKNYLLGFLQGWLPSVEGCLHCGRCAVECPVEIDLPALLWKSQFADYDRRGRSWKKMMLDDPELLAKLGSWTAPLANQAIKTSLVKAIMQRLTGIHRRAPLPRFHSETFRNWYGGGRRG